MTSASALQAITKQLQDAAQLHQAGHHAEAEQLYDNVLKQAPTHADALNLKGLLALSQSRISEAVELLRRAANSAPSFPPIHFNLGNALAAAGRPDAALDCYRKALSLDTIFADAYLNAGALLDQLGRHDEAAAVFRTMIQYCPRDARGFQNLALCLVSKLKASAGEAKVALAAEVGTAFERACDLDPTDAASRFAYANLLAEHKDHGNAIAYYEAALKLKPDWPEALSNLGDSLRKSGRPSEAIINQREALAFRPHDENILAHLGNSLRDVGAYDEAVDIFQSLLRQNPKAILPYVNLANAYRETWRMNEAIATLEEAMRQLQGTYEPYGSMGTTFADLGWFAAADLLNKKAIAIKGANAKVRFNQSMVALALGRFKEGWQGYEERFDSPDYDLAQRAAPPLHWRGEDLANKSILIWTEQGLGDEILHATMLPEVVAKAQKCVLACSERMAPIFARSFPQCSVIGFKKTVLDAANIPLCDYQISIASLGQYLRPHFESFPIHQGHLKSAADKMRAFRTRYEDLAQGRRIVGLSWRSKGQYGAAKSMALIQLAPLLTANNVFFVNLQYGDCTAEIAEVAAKLGVEIYVDTTADPLRDMDAFFAQVAAMDLVITTSNTTVHVAGAQNIPAWVMLPFGRGAMWYWFLHHPLCAWYTSVQLIRAPSRAAGGQWWTDIIEPTARRFEAWVKETQIRNLN